MIEHLERQLSEVLIRIKEILSENQGKEIASQIKLIESITGVGFISAVTLIAEIGDFSVFKKPKQLVAYFGIDPTVKESGDFKGSKVKMSKRGSSLARRVLFNVAVASVRRSNQGKAINSVIRAYYDKKLVSKAKKSALGAIMRKITNIIFAVLRDNEEYKIRTPKEHENNYKSIHDLKLAA